MVPVFIQNETAVFHNLSQSTSTPGLVGEDRRTELKRRLMLAICGSSGQESDNMADDLISKNDKVEVSVRPYRHCSFPIHQGLFALMFNVMLYCLGIRVLSRYAGRCVRKGAYDIGT